MIGRIYKSRWQEASEAQDVGKVRQFLVKAVDAYRAASRRTGATCTRA
jgi:hypothetical protein